MKTLIYAAGMGGHLQVYARAIAGFLLEAGYEVRVATAAGKGEWAARWPILRALAEDGRVQGLDSRTTAGSGSGEWTAEQLLAAQRDCRADATLLIDGDAFAAQFRRIAAGEAPRLQGRICAIFGRTSEWCPGEDPYTGLREPWIGPTLRRTLGRMRRAIHQRGDSPRRFFERDILGRRVVDAVIVKDERILRHHGPPVHWMPEIYRVFDPRPEERRGADWERFAEPVQRFVARAGAENVLLFFGAAAWYKGYDLFLKLARDESSTFALHAGARGTPDPRYGCDLEPLRQELLRQGRLFEADTFVSSGDLMDLLFGGIARFVSTHRLTLSSATMLQALEKGKPVLAPATGLVGWRTREFGLGATYAYADSADFLTSWRRFKSGALDPSSRSISTFMDSFSRERTRRFFLDVLTGDAP
ncbi:MAG TPA: hypothetical protein PLJ99_00080 [Kiritimatiellia bacterium]|nr:hypothetical protein [Kiritimatiellia bacterium]HPJ56154.1 hypothetical protein [Kiritimatiellia bacterium]HPR67667.1 hypothetical protein [Kiritimatiellia bacterium]